MSQEKPLPRVHLGPRTSGRHMMIRWDAVHSEISQPAPLRQAFTSNLALQTERFFGQAMAPSEVARRAAEAEAAERPGEAVRLRVDLSRAIAYAVVDTLQVESSPRYRQEPPKTYCNIYAYDVVTALGGFIPRVWWMDKAIAQLRRGEAVQPVYAQTVRELSANMLTEWMHTFGAEFGWVRARDIDAAQWAANQGRLVILLAARVNRSESGHINVILAETEEHRAARGEDGRVIRPLQSQAGATNFRYRPHPNTWWRNEGYEMGGAWIYGGENQSPLLPPEEVGMLAAGLETLEAPPVAPAPSPAGKPRARRTAKAQAAIEGTFPGRRRGAGYTYDGGASASYTVQRVFQLVERYRLAGDLRMAQACEAFLRVASEVGWISAIDTSDKRVFVWGAGLAQDDTLPWMWANLDDSVKAYLAQHPQAGRYFGGDGMHITREIRRDAEALNAVVYVSEQEPYRGHVFDAQIKAFMAHALGMER